MSRSTRTAVRYWTNQQNNPRLLWFNSFQEAVDLVEGFLKCGYRAEIAPPHIR